MPAPRAVIFEACDFLGSAVGYHGEFEDTVLRWELDHLEARSGQTVHQRFAISFAISGTVRTLATTDGC